MGLQSPPSSVSTPSADITVFYLFGVELIYNLAFVSGVQQSDSVTHTSVLFQILFTHRLLPNIEYSSLCCTVGACCVSVLYIEVCVCVDRKLLLSLPRLPFGNQPSVCFLCLCVPSCFENKFICVVFWILCLAPCEPHPVLEAQRWGWAQVDASKLRLCCCCCSGLGAWFRTPGASSSPVLGITPSPLDSQGCGVSEAVSQAGQAVQGADGSPQHHWAPAAWQESLPREGTRGDASPPSP